MNIINIMFDLLFLPFKNLNPVYGLIFVSILTGMVMLIIFRYTSNQKAIKKVKASIKAHFLEIRLFKDNLKVLTSAMGNIVLKNLNYMRYSLVPLCFMFIPVIIIIIQLALRYEYRPLKPNEHTILSVKLEEDIPDEGKFVRLKLPDGIIMDAGPVHIPANKSVSWRLKPLKPGSYNVEIQVDDESIMKKIIATDQLVPISTQRSNAKIKQFLFNPTEPPLPKKFKISRVSISYPDSKLVFTIFGWVPHWLVVFFATSLISGFLLKGVFKVEI